MALTRREGAVLVLGGSFNPAIYHPAWMARVGLATLDDAANARINFHDPVLSRFEIAEVAIEVRSDQITAASVEGSSVFEAIGEVTIGMLEVLPHAPVWSIGMNRVVHARLPKSGFDHLASRLSSTQTWRGLLEAPRLTTITVEGTRPNQEGVVSVTVEPSDLEAGGAYVVATQRLVNPDKRDGQGAEWGHQAISQAWLPWMAESDGLITAVLSLGSG